MNSFLKIISLTLFVCLFVLNLHQVNGKAQVPDAESIEEALKYLRELDEKYSNSARPRYGKRVPEFANEVPQNYAPIPGSFESDAVVQGLRGFS